MLSLNPQPSHVRALHLNIALDRRLSRLENSIIDHYESFISDWIGAPDELLDVFVQADKSHLERYNRDGCCRGLDAVHAVSLRLARVVDFDGLYYYHIGPFEDRPITRANRDYYLQLVIDSPKVFATRLKNQMRGRRNLFWVTPAEELTRVIQASRAEAAENVRAALGLVHYQNKVELIALEFPEKFLQKVTVPTFVDGGSHPVFCVWDEPNPQYGYSWDLARHNRGLRELVSQNKDLDARVSVHYVGRLETDAPRIQWERLLSR